MHQQKSKKVLIYIFLFLIIGTLNNKNLNKMNFTQINTINILGLENNDSYELNENLDYLKLTNLFFINRSKVTNIINSNTLVEKFYVFKKYPSTLNIEIQKTKFLAQTQIKNDNFFLGSNGKFTKTFELRSDIPHIFGDFTNINFFDLKKAIDDSNFRYDQIKSLFFYKSGRWDIEMYNGLLIKLPKHKIKQSLELLILFLDLNKDKKIKQLDLRQNKQIILNG